MADEKGIVGKTVDQVKKLGTAAEKVVTPLQKMNEVFENLSTTGNTFGNDIIKMQIAAANSRMPLEDFAKLLQENNTTMGTLAGSVGKGSQVFADLAKSFHASGLAENLRQMGFSSRELNEVLALQVGFQKSTYENSVEGQKKATAAAASLAMEMDALTQITGQSRKDQEENLKKVQADMKLESKFRMIGAMYGADKEKEARDNFAANYTQMAAKGMGDLYKEVFATGTTMTKGAQAQQSMFGKAGLAAAKSAVELSRGNSELAKVYNERAQVEVMALQKSRAFLAAGIWATGDIGEAVRGNIKANDTAFHGMQQTMKEHKIATNDITEALKKQREEIKKEQDARSGVTQSIRTFGIVMDDVRAAIANRLLTNINKELNKPGLDASGQFLQTKPGEDPRKRAQLYADALEKEAAGDKANKLTPASRQKLIEEVIGQYGGDLATQLLGFSAKAAVSAFKGDLKETLREGFNQLTVGTINVGEIKQGKEGRAGGTLGETGRVVEPKDVHALLHKGEMVLTQEQQKNLISNVRTEAIADIMAKIQNQATVSQPGKLPSIDLNKFAKDIATTTSKVEVQNWPKEFKVADGAATAGAQKPAEQKPAEKKEETKPTETKAEKASKVAEEVLIKSGDTLSGLAKKYGTSVAEIMKANPAIKDANKILAGAKLTIPGQEKKEETKKEEKKDEKKTEQATISDADARKSWREREAKTLEKQTPTQASVRAVDNAIDKKPKEDTKSNYTETSKTTVKVNGKEVDPNSQEGKNAVAFLKEKEEKLNKAMSEGFDPQKIATALQSQVSASVQKDTGGGDNVVRRNAEEAAQENNKFKIKVEQDYNDHWVKTRDEAAQKIVDLEKKAATETLTKREQNELTFQKNLKAQADEEIATSTANLEIFKNLGKEMGKAITSPLTDAKEEIKSNSEKIKEDMKEALPVQGMRDKTEEMNKLAERRTEIEERLLERQGEVDGLKALANERALTEEEQAQLKLAENGVIRAQNNLKSNLEQQEELAAALGIAKKDSDSKILEQTKQANQEMSKIIVAPLTDAKEEVKSNSEKIKEDMKEALPVQGMRDKTEEMNKLAERRTEIEERLLERQGEVDGLKALANERALTEEEQAQLKLAENGVIRAQNNLKSNLEQQEELAAALGIAKKDSDSKILEQTKQANQEMSKIIVAPLTDAKEEVKSNSEKIKEDMKEALPVQGMRDKTEEMNKLAERRTEIEERLLERQGEVDGLKALANERALTEEEQAQLKLAENGVIRAQNNLKSNLEQQEELAAALGIAKKETDEKILEQTEEANKAQVESYGGLTDSVIAARDKFMEELNEAPQGEGSMDSAFARDEYGEGGDAIGGEMNSAFAKDEYSAFKDLTSQVQGLTDSQMLEANEEPQGEGSMDSAFAEDEDDYVSQALKNISSQLPQTMDSTADDAAYAAGPGDTGTGDASVAEAMAKKPAKGPASEANFAPISMGDFTLGPNGLPTPKPKAEAKNIPNEVKKDEKKAQEDKKAKDAQKKADKDGKKQDQKTTETTQKKENKTLDDVVKTLETLNSNMNRLINKVEETGKNQVNATKSMNGNLFNR